MSLIVAPLKRDRIIYTSTKDTSSKGTSSKDTSSKDTSRTTQAGQNHLHGETFVPHSRLPSTTSSQFQIVSSRRRDRIIYTANFFAVYLILALNNFIPISNSLITQAGDFLRLDLH